jgi:hypothetical protein
MKVSELKNLIEGVISKEVRNKIISESKEVYHIKCEGVPLGTFDSEEAANEALPSYKAKHDGELIIEKGQYESNEDMLDKLDEMNDELEETEDMNEMNDSDTYDNFDSIQDELREKAQSLFEKEKINEQELYEIENIIDTELEKYMDFSNDGADVHNMFVHIVKDVAPHLIKKKKKENMESQQPMEGNEFSGALKAARDAGEKSFTVDGKEYDVEECWTKEMSEEEEECDECGDTEMKEGTCEKCGKELCECGSGMYESKKKRTIRLTESELTKLIAKMVNESIPGLDAVKSAHDGDKETKQHLSDVEQKMKDSASFDGNDNPEFPKPIGKGEKVARQNTEKENEYVEDTRGGTLLNLEYNTEPSDQFKNRLKKALEGDATTGNSQEYANVIKSDTGKNLAKQAERKKKKEDAEFSVSWGHSWKSPEEVKVVNETTFKMSNVLEEEIKKMKDMVNYNKKTQ